MVDLVPIKVTLLKGLTDKNGNPTVWPPFYQMAPAIFDNKPPSDYIDEVGIGWHLDKLDNLGTGAASGTACTCLPKTVADAIIAAGHAVKMTEAEWQTHHDDRAHAHEDDEHRDETALTGLKAEIQLVAEALNEVSPGSAAETKLLARRKAVRQLLVKTLDPNDVTRGIRKNMRKKWADVKATRGITIVQ